MYLVGNKLNTTKRILDQSEQIIVGGKFNAHISSDLW